MKDWLRHKVHISWFVAALSAGIIVGTALCLVVASDGFAHTGWFVVAAALFGMAIIKRPRILIFLAIFAGILTGLTRGSLVEQQFAGYQPFYGKSVSLTGRVVEDASYGTRGDQRIRLGDAQIDNQQLSGEVWASLSVPGEVKRGDRVTLKGMVNEGFGNLQATMFRAELQEIVRPQPGDVGRVFRDWFTTGIARAIPEPQRNLGIGFLVGQKSALPETLEQQIRTVGLTHVVVASGYNLMILVVFARKYLSRASKYLAALAGSLMISGFILITGLSPSMSRAGLVAGIGLLAWYYGRRSHPLVLLSFAAAATLLVRPAYIWGDIGWFLSFAAFAGVIVLAPLLHSYFWGVERKASFIRDLVVATISAQIMTLPIIMFVFGQYSIYALPANLLVLPVVPFAMLFTFLAGVGGLIIPGLAGFFGVPATALLSYCTFVIEKIANLPSAQGEVSVSRYYLAGSYIFAVLLMIWLWRKTKHNFRLANSRLSEI